MLAGMMQYKGCHVSVKAILGLHQFTLQLQAQMGPLVLCSAALVLPEQRPKDEEASQR